ncbi:unnamed protein product, partial [Ectocarpus sp. 4 AP-2014]
ISYATGSGGADEVNSTARPRGSGPRPFSEGGWGIGREMAGDGGGGGEGVLTEQHDMSIVEGNTWPRCVASVATKKTKVTDSGLDFECGTQGALMFERQHRDQNNRRNSGTRLRTTDAHLHYPCSHVLSLERIGR